LESALVTADLLQCGDCSPSVKWEIILNIGSSHNLPQAEAHFAR
jgi:hypothetical protein